MKHLISVLRIFLFVMLLCGCIANDRYKEIPVDETYLLALPDHFPELQQDISSNYPTKYGIELGRRLFYDVRLSRDHTISCAFCHEQQHAFTHHGHDLSHGIDNQTGLRNTPAIQNMIYQSEYFFDGASNSIQMLSIVPIHNPVEMDETLAHIAEKLKQDPEYVRLFKTAFDAEVSSSGILNALAQFMTIMISADAEYDRYLLKKEGADFSTEEKKGLALFRQHCASCHATNIFTDNSFRNNGLMPNPRINDLGRATVTGFAEDRYKFKVPSLRNVALTAPYMHDGRFGSLESVLHFYSDGVTETENLDPLMKTNNRLGIPLSEEEKRAIIAFLKTLTDTQFIRNQEFYHKT